MCCPLQAWRSLFISTNIPKKQVEIEETIWILCEFAHVLALQVAPKPFRADATSWDEGAEPFHHIRVVKVELCCFIQNISNIRAVSCSERWSLCSDAIASCWLYVAVNSLGRHTGRMMSLTQLFQAGCVQQFFNVCFFCFVQTENVCGVFFSRMPLAEGAAAPSGSFWFSSSSVCNCHFSSARRLRLSRLLDHQLALAWTTSGEKTLLRPVGVPQRSVRVLCCYRRGFYLRPLKHPHE